MTGVVDRVLRYIGLGSSKDCGTDAAPPPQEAEELDRQIMDAAARHRVATHDLYTKSLDDAEHATQASEAVKAEVPFDSYQHAARGALFIIRGQDPR